ncbi:MAG: bilirubin oxidase, partial [Desulfofustis sp.]|nr:bilirubin oxidase [Desulfofustis sp.]
MYAGPAGFWLLRDRTEADLNLPGPAPQLGDPPGTRHYEIPLAIQDRSFHADGSLFYPEGRQFFDEYKGPYHPETPASPHWNPEVFGNAMLVNGRTWPYLEVEPRLYRFRMLNGSNSRFMVLRFDRAGLVFHQIGSDGGLLPGAPLRQDQLLMAPAERVDAIVDFSAFQPGDEIVMLNLGPDEPYKGPNPEEKQAAADPKTTGLVMKFKVTALTENGNKGEIPTQLPAIDALTTSLQPRDITLNEHMYDAAGIPVAALLGTGAQGPLTWGDAVTENPMVGDVEIWRIINLTEDAHPVHLHLV